MSGYGEDPADTAPVTLDAVTALLRAMASAARICSDEMDGDLVAEVLHLHADGLAIRAIETVSGE